MTSAFASIPTVAVVSSDSRVKVEQLPHSDRMLVGVLGPLHYDCLTRASGRADAGVRQGRHQNSSSLWILQIYPRKQA